MKTRLELECICKTCDMKFVIWDKWLPTFKDVDSGSHIGKFVCPNCGLDNLDLDIVVRENKSQIPEEK